MRALEKWCVTKVAHCINYITVIAGDFNCAPDCKLDREPCHNSNDQGCIELHDLIQNCNLYDIFRRRHPDKKSFTFKRGTSKSRIDYFLTETSCDNSITSKNIVHFPFSDHDIINIATNFSKIELGPGVWKMNVATIHSTQFQESIEYLWSTWKSKITDYTNILVWWELVKYKSKQLTI